MYVFKFVLVSLAMLTIFGAHLDERCSKNRDCHQSNTFCEIVTPSCGNGVCACIPGFNSNGTTCLRAVFLGGNCDPRRDQCIGENVECTPNLDDNFICTCKYGYKRGLKESDCVPSLMSEVAGQQCHDTSQCYYSLVCVNNVCSCYNGFKPAGTYNCIAREVGDKCSSVEDCSQRANMICVNGQCECSQGYKTIHYLSDITVSYRTACIKHNEAPAQEGEYCSNDEDKPVYCRAPYLCTFCGDRHVCAIRDIHLLSRQTV